MVYVEKLNKTSNSEKKYNESISFIFWSQTSDMLVTQEFKVLQKTVYHIYISKWYFFYTSSKYFAASFLWFLNNRDNVYS